MEDNSQRDLFAPILSNDALMGPFLLIARLFTTGIFVFYIYFEIVKIIHAPSALLYLAVVAQFVGIVLVALGYRTRFAAILLAVCLITILLVIHWSLGLGISFVAVATKTTAVTAGFFFMFAYGPGPLSLDRYRGASKPLILDNTAVMGPLLLAGRIMATFVFFYMDMRKIFHTAFVQNYMSIHHVPPNLIYLAILTQTVFPLLVLLGYKTRYGALALAGFCLIASSLFHTAFSNPYELQHFFLDWAIAGGLLFMFAQGPGPLSLDALMNRASAREPRLAVEKA